MKISLNTCIVFCEYSVRQTVVSRRSDISLQWIEHLSITGSKSNTRLIAGVIWKPFDTRFEETIERMDLYCTVVKEELSLLQLKEGKISRQTFEAEAARAAEERKKAAVAREQSSNLQGGVDALRRAFKEETRSESLIILISFWLTHIA